MKRRETRLAVMMEDDQLEQEDVLAVAQHRVASSVSSNDLDRSPAANAGCRCENHAAVVAASQASMIWNMAMASRKSKLVSTIGGMYR